MKKHSYNFCIYSSTPENAMLAFLLKRSWSSEEKMEQKSITALNSERALQSASNSDSCTITILRHY